MLRGAPMVIAIMLSLLVVEWLLQRQLEYRPLFYGAIAFVVAWSGHLAFAVAIKKRLGVESVPSAAFGAFTTLLGLVFSLLLGQTFSYYFARQGAIQDAAFREISELQRLLDLCLSFAQKRGFLTRERRGARHADRLHSKALHILQLLEVEALSLAPGGDGLAASTKLVNSRRALQGVLEHLADLSTDENTKNDPATIAALTAAQQAVTAISEARALRVSQINADLPAAQFLTLNLLGGLLLGSFLLTDLKNDQLEAALFGAIAASATVIKQVLGDLASPFSGSWSIAPAHLAASDLLRVVREELAAAGGGRALGMAEMNATSAVLEAVLR